MFPISENFLCFLHFIKMFCCQNDGYSFINPLGYNNCCWRWSTTGVGTFRQCVHHMDCVHWCSASRCWCYYRRWHCFHLEWKKLCMKLFYDTDYDVVLWVQHWMLEVWQWSNWQSLAVLSSVFWAQGIFNICGIVASENVVSVSVSVVSVTVISSRFC